MTGPLVLVLAQVIALWSVLAGVALYARRRDGRPPIDDVGFFWLLALTVYATLPPISWLIQGGSYPLLSGRLFRLQPEAHEVSELLNIALGYSLAFTVFYLRARRRAGAPAAVVQPYISDTKLAAAMAILVLGILFGLVLGASGLVRGAESYADSYAVVLALPLGLRQLLKVFSQFQFIATIVLTIALVQRWPRSRPWLVLYVLSVFLMYDPEGPRTVLGRSLLMLVVVWHVLVRPISFKKFIAGGVLAFVVFMALGILRAINALGGGGEFTGVLNQGEFDVLWGNAVELLQNSRAGDVDVPASVRFIELFEFVPSQLLWFEKTSLSIWYLDTFYPIYKESGGGLAFGALAQAAIGGGVIEAMLRGAILGAICGRLVCWFRKPSGAWWRFPLYLYLVIMAYQSVRDTTFSLVSFLIQGVIPGLLLIAGVAYVLGSARRTAQSAKSA